MYVSVHNNMRLNGCFVQTEHSEYICVKSVFVCVCVCVFTLNKGTVTCCTADLLWIRCYDVQLVNILEGFLSAVHKIERICPAGSW